MAGELVCRTNATQRNAYSILRGAERRMRRKKNISTNRLCSVSKITIINSRDTRSYVLSTAKNHKKPAHTRRCGLAPAVRSISLSLSLAFFIITIIFVFVCFSVVLLRVLPPLFHIIFSARIYFFGNLNKRLAKEMNEAEKTTNRQHREEFRSKFIAVSVGKPCTGTLSQ